MTTISTGSSVSHSQSAESRMQSGRPGRSNGMPTCERHRTPRQLLAGGAGGTRLTPPAGSRAGIGALHVGYYDQAGQLHYAGGVGTGFTQDELRTFRELLAGMASDPPTDLLVAGDPIERSAMWVRP